MTSRLDRLFTLLESCPNASLRSAAAKHLGELAQLLPANVEHIFIRLIPLLRHRNWTSRVAAADVIRSIIQHLPVWKPVCGTDTQGETSTSTDDDDGFLSLRDLQLHRVLAQGARLYSMDARDLERQTSSVNGKYPRVDKTSARSAQDTNEIAKENGVSSTFDITTPLTTQSSLQRRELNSRLGLNEGPEGQLLTSVLASHSNVSLTNCIDDEDLDDDQACPGAAYPHLDVEACVRSTFSTAGGEKRRRLSPPGAGSSGSASVEHQPIDRWPLDRMCTQLLGDLWDPSWETRHGAASGLRELLSDGRHTRQAGKRSGMTAAQMQDSHTRYLEDIVVRVLCTLALDQLSDFISDEVVAPVRETAAQLLGVLSRHLTEEQVLLVAKHLIYLVTEVSHQQLQPLATNSCLSSTSWMIVHGGLLGIKYLVASRKDLRPSILPLVTPCLLSQLLLQPHRNSHSASQPADEDIRAAAASALLPVVDADWAAADGEQVVVSLSEGVWRLLDDICSSSANELSPATGPLLQLVACLTQVEAGAAARSDTGVDDRQSPLRLTRQVGIVLRLVHHISSAIRLQALTTLACLVDTWQRQEQRLVEQPAAGGSTAARKLVDLPLGVLQVILDQLFHRIVLESTSSVRSQAVFLCHQVICSTGSTEELVRACLPRLDYWLCQSMQPVGVPFAPHLMLPPPPRLGGEQASPGCAVAAPPQVQSSNQHSTGESNCTEVGHQDRSLCIGGSSSVSGTQAQLETFVLETRLSIIRLLAVLFARLCQYTKALPLQTPASVGQPPDPASAVDLQPPPTEQAQPISISMLAYCLDRILCRVHLTDRLAMQRFVGGLILTSWSLLPSSSSSDTVRTGGSVATWGQRLAAALASPCPPPEGHEANPSVSLLASGLRARLECCLTEVVYYEEILGIFKLMQDDCRELARQLVASGASQDPILSLTSVRTIAQSSELVQFAVSHINTRYDPAGVRVSDELSFALERARVSVDRCLALQLDLASRVELAISCSLVNFGWLLPGRLSLLIRPLMDTVRCSQSVRSTALPRSPSEPQQANSEATELPPVGSFLRLQRLAAYGLARLLHLEWAARRPSADLAVNPSRAAAKVVKNLVTALVEADPQLRRPPLPSGEEGADESGNLPAVPNSRVAVVDEASLVASGELCQRQPSEENSRPVWLECQQRGVTLALTSMCSVFLKADTSLCRGLPGLWRSMWVDPVEAIAKFVAPVVDVNSRQCCSVLDTVERFVTGTRQPTSLPSIPDSTAETVTSGLLVLSVCVPTVLSAAERSPTTTSDVDGLPRLSFRSLVHVGAAATFLPVCRAVGCRLLTALAVLCPARLLNSLLPVLLPRLQACGRDAELLGALDTLGSILERATASTGTGDVHPADLDNSAGDQLTDDPLQDLVPVSAGTGTVASVSASPGLPDALLSLVPFTVLLLPPVLRLLSDRNADIRTLAGRLFAQLLMLLPFESSVPDPPEMLPAFREARSQQRHFVDSLLHPQNIQAYNLPVTIRADLRGYQQDGINWLSFLNRYGLNGILCDDLGLGKTLQTICILAGSHHELTAQQQPAALSSGDGGSQLVATTTANCSSSSLVVCPATLCSHWLHEVRQYAPLDTLVPVVYAGAPSVRQGLQNTLSAYTLVITSYDMIRIDVDFFASVVWNYVVLDEGHIIKSSKSKVSRALKQLRSKHRLILTGTPIQNRVEDLWSLFDFLMPDFLGSEANFLSRFSRPVAVSRDPKASKTEQHAGMLALEKLHRLVLPFMLRRLKEDVLADLPPKIIQDFACEMTSVQTMLYDSFTSSEEGESLVHSLSATSPSLPSESATPVSSSPPLRYGFQALRYLQAICNHPCLALRPGHPAMRTVREHIRREFGANTQLTSVHLSGKLLALCRLLTECGFGNPVWTAGSQTGPQATKPSASPDHLDSDTAGRLLLSQHRALIFFQTREMLQLTSDMLKTHFPSITTSRLDGTIPVAVRQETAMRFNSDPSIDIMLLTTAVGGLGLNLTGADTVIFVEHDWNPSKDLQAMDRVHRIGQRRTVNVYRLITEASVEEQIMNLQTFKLHLANTVIGADNQSLASMDTGHLFDRLPAGTAPLGEEPPASVDALEAAYETEYNLEAFVGRLKGLASDVSSSG